MKKKTPIKIEGKEQCWKNGKMFAFLTVLMFSDCCGNEMF